MCKTWSMGAIPLERGVRFRVWAPQAQSVHVAGTFNGWDTERHPLNRENGTWVADVAEAAIGDEYKFVIRREKHVLWRNDPYAREVTHWRGNSVIADPHYDWRMRQLRLPHRSHLIIYQLHVGTFLYDPTSSDGHGTLTSLRSRLPYLRDLGVNVIQLVAAGEYPTDRCWAFNTSHLFAIESAYGGPNGFRQLVDAAHALRLAVIVTLVYDHLGPRDLDLWTFDGWSALNAEGGIYFYDNARAFNPFGPRPHYGAPEVREFLRESAVRWVDSRGVDGVCWDGTAWVRNVYGRNDDPTNDLGDAWSLMRMINQEVKAVAPKSISIASDLHDKEAIVKPIHDGGAGFDTQWGGGFHRVLRENVTRVDDRERNMYAMANMIEQTFCDDAFARVLYSESHDSVSRDGSRLPEAIWPGNATHYFAQKRSTLAAAVVFTAPGIPMIFQGQEFLENGRFDALRQVDWQKESEFNGIWMLYRDLIDLRRNVRGVTRGLTGKYVKVFHVNDHDKVIAFYRRDRGGPKDDVVVLLNFSNVRHAQYTIGLPAGGRWEVRFNSDWSGYSTAFGNSPANGAVATAGARDGFGHQASFGLGPYTAVILSQDE